jgi:hypothetical protein
MEAETLDNSSTCLTVTRDLYDDHSLLPWVRAIGLTLFGITVVLAAVSIVMLILLRKYSVMLFALGPFLCLYYVWGQLL